MRLASPFRTTRSSQPSGASAPSAKQSLWACFGVALAVLCGCAYIERMLALKLALDLTSLEPAASEYEAAMPTARVVGARPHSPSATIIPGRRALEPARVAELASTLQSLGTDAEAAAYTFFCEAITNVLDHAYCGPEPRDDALLWHAAAEIDVTAGRLLLTVTDSGCGLPRSLPRLHESEIEDPGRTASPDHELLAAALSLARGRTTSRGQGFGWFVRLAERWNGQLVVESLGSACVFSPAHGLVATEREVYRRGTLVQIDAPLISARR